MRTTTCLVMGFAFALFMGTSAAMGEPLGTAFTYQGRLEQNDSPVNGMVDFDFSLWDADASGKMLGAVAVDGVAVTDGLFTVALDFGENVFAGEQLWLEVAVNGGLPLSPRQEVTATPYALKTRGLDGHSLDAVDGNPTDALFVDNGGNVGIGTTSPSARLVATYASPNSTNSFPVAIFDNPGGNATVLSMRIGNLEQARIRTNSVGDLVLASGNSTGNIHLGTPDLNYRMSIIGSSGNVGIGTTGPAQKLDVAGTAQMTGFKLPTGAANGRVLTSDATGVGMWQVQSPAGDTTPDTIADDGVISDAEASDALTINNGLLFAPTSGDLGIGTTSPLRKLDVRGDVGAGTSGSEFAVSAAGKITTPSVQTASLENAAVTSEKAALTILHNGLPGPNGIPLTLQVIVPASTVPRYALVVESAGIHANTSTAAVMAIMYDGALNIADALRSVSTSGIQELVVATNTRINIPGDNALHTIQLRVYHPSGQPEFVVQGVTLDVLLVAQ